MPTDEKKKFGLRSDVEIKWHRIYEKINQGSIPDWEKEDRVEKKWYQPDKNEKK